MCKCGIDTSYCGKPKNHKTMLDFPNKKIIPCKIGKFISHGAFGEVYSIVDHPDKVIKLSYAIEEDECFNSTEELEEVFKKMKRSSSKYTCKLFDYKIAKIKGDHYFYYIAEKLIRPPILKVRHFIENYCNRKSANKHRTYLRNKGLYHDDPHEGNVMMNKLGELKLIDLDGICII